MGLRRLLVRMLDAEGQPDGRSPVTSGGTVIWGTGGLDAEAVRDTIGSALVAGANVTISVNDAGDTITIAATDTNTTDQEVVRDTIGAALVAGGGISVTVNDAGDTITISSTGGFDTEAARDAIGAALVAGTGISIVVNDPGDTITISSTVVANLRPLTTVIGSVPDFVWDDSDELVQTEVTL